MVNSALDDCAPIKTFISRPGYITGLTQETKTTMNARGKARAEMKNSTGEKWILLAKYRKLRNKASGFWLQ